MTMRYGRGAAAAIGIIWTSGALHFEHAIAPLLVQHCFECHDSTLRKGGLDLSRKEAALKVLVPGKAGESVLWEYVESGEMPPPDRPALSSDQKQLLRQWIDDGAVWSGETIDPLVVRRDRRASELWVMRLTVPEYIETVRSATGVDIEREARQRLPRDLRADGFSNTGYNLGVDLAHIEAYAGLAELIVERMDIPAFVSEITPETELTEAGLRTVVAGIGKWLLRGPLEEPELETFLGVARAVQDEGGHPAEAVGYVVEAMLQAPRFLYRIESQRGDGTIRPVDDHALAARLSYMLWGAPPDPELIRAADAMELSSPGVLEHQVHRMLKDPRAVSRSAQFVYEWLDLARLDTLRPSPERFPHWNDQLASDMLEETLAFFHEIVWRQRRPLGDLLNAQVTYATPRLARHYGLDSSTAMPLPEPLPAYARPVGISRPIPPGLQARYTFEEGSGRVIRDRSGVGEPLELEIADPTAVRWGNEGLTLTGSTLISSPLAANRLIEAIRHSGEITLEAWITPANSSQTGPARIVSVSDGASRRNFTLGQDGSRYEVRLRSASTSENGIPGRSSPAGTARAQRSHLHYVRNAEGQTTLYVDGQRVAEGAVTGDLLNWDDGFNLLLGNESSQDRPWQGTFHALAIYSQALSPEELRLANAPARYDLEAVPARGGLLTQGSTLTVGGDEASMVTRGLFVLHEFLHATVGSAPPGVDTTPIPTKPGLSQRGAAESRLANASCAGCHSKFEPFAFGLERFDGLGAYARTDEHGNLLREDGQILLPDQDTPATFQSATELMDLLAASRRVRMNFTRKLTQFAIGRPLAGSDAPILQEIHAKAEAGGGTYESLIAAIATSDLVRLMPIAPDPGRH
jgi:hypothetical protein